LAISVLNGINNLSGTHGLSKVDFKINNNENQDSANVEKTSFNDFLGKALDQLNQTQQVAENDKLLLASGQADNLPQIMINSQKAELSLQFASQIRNKAVDAYNEIMRIQM
jgi:flagellar hook-basal body complex protein FliE